MAVLHDWDALLKQYSIDYEAEPVSPAEWCSRIGLPYSSAKRYITVKAAKNEIALRNSQAKKRTPKPGRDEKGVFPTPVGVFPVPNQGRHSGGGLPHARGGVSIFLL